MTSAIETSAMNTRHSYALLRPSNDSAVSPK